MFRRERFGELIRRQLDLFVEDEAALLREADAAERRTTPPTATSAEEAYGDYQLVLEAIAEPSQSCATPMRRRSTGTRPTHTSRPSTVPPKRFRLPLQLRRALMLIEDYGLIGDLQTAALVGRNGSIDWLCFPRFDSGACFAALLGDERNGRWLLTPDCEIQRVERRYRERTLVHELDFHTRDRQRSRDRLHAAARQRSRRRPHRRGTRGQRADADGAGDPLRLRLDRPVGSAARRRHPDRDRRAGRPGVQDAGGDARREHEHRRGVHSRAAASASRSC